MRQEHRCDRASVKVACVKDHQLGGVARLIDDEADQPSLILTRIRVRRHKDELAWMAASTEVVSLPNALDKIMLVEAPGALEAPIGLHSHRV